MKATKELFKSVFLATYQQYQPISEAHRFTTEERQMMKFKALDAETGNIFLIDHPDAWRVEHSTDGRPTYFRNPPKLLATHENAKREMNKPTGLPLLEQEEAAGF